MRRLAIWMLFVAIASASSVAKDVTVDELKSRLASARPEDRPGLCIQIAQQQLRIADQLYVEGKTVEARAAVGDVVTYSDQARDAAMQTRKHLKNVEIAARKMVEKLRDIKRTLAFEDQPPVDQAIRRLEEIRTALLDQMFPKGKK